jgi:hypothetical protein
MLSTAVYNGPHAASTRVMLGFLMYRNTEEKVSNAIAIRLRPNPPLSAAYCNLEIFADALHAARFFEAIGTIQEYLSFKNHMKEIKATMFYVAPYAKYLYGKSSPDPLNAKAEAGKLGSYAVALNSALPGSTLGMSPALLKLADQQGRNSISAALYVDAYVIGFKRFFSVSVENKIKKLYGVTREQSMVT